jgi:hypothetical protein
MDLKIRLIPDKYHLRCVGQLEVGAQFWIDVQLKVENSNTRDFVATYVFDTDGVLIWNEIINLGLRTDTDQLAPSAVIEEQLVKLGAYKKTDISVYPFSVNAYGSKFGLVVRKPDLVEPEDQNDDDQVLVDALPGWTLMFYPPWNEGLYDT